MALTLTALASDNCQRANENPLSDGGNWSILSSNFTPMQLASNKIEPSAANSDCGMYWNGLSWPKDQYCKITVGAFTTVATKDLNFNLLLRNNSTNSLYNYYELAINKTSVSKSIIVSVNNSASFFGNVVLGSISTGLIFNIGDVWIFAIVGYTLYVYQNGTLLGTYTDPNKTIASGSVGFFENISTGVPVTDLGASAWEGGSVSLGGGNGSFLSTALATSLRGVRK
jgi:hypothetical protein